MFTHSKDAIASSEARNGFTGWDLDSWAKENNWQGVGLLPVSTHRDADSLTRSNWDAAFTQLTERFGKGCIAAAHFTHWAVGWTDVGTYDTGNKELSEAVAKMRKELEAYPVLDEDLFSEYEYEESHPDNDDVCYYEYDCDCGRTSYRDI